MEQRSSVEAQLGYLTGVVEQLGSSLKESNKALHDYVRSHMDAEEVKFASINDEIAKQRKYTLLLTLFVFANSAGYNLNDLLSLIGRYFL